MPQHITAKQETTLRVFNFRHFAVEVGLVALLPMLALAQPRIFYSDLESGPNSSGENNGGVWVSVYGERFGVSQGSSRVTVGGGLAATYRVWSDTKITLQLGSAASTGDLVVTTSVGASNSVPFTVRAGQIYFVTPDGNDSNIGSFESPWKTLPHAVQIAGASAGNIIYAMSGVSQTTDDGQGADAALTLQSAWCNTSGYPSALLAYPGATVTIGNADGSFPSHGLRGAACGGSWTFAGINFRGTNPVQLTGTSSHWRFVANDVTCPTAGTAAAPSKSCFSASQAGDLKFLGNSVHDAGAADASSQFQGASFSTDSNSLEIGWNTIANVRGCRGLELHSTPLGNGDLDDPTGFPQHDISIHDNVIHDTQCDGVVINTIDPSKGPVSLHNNIIYNAGKGPNNPEQSGSWTCINLPHSGDAHGVLGTGVVEIYNNTLYNCGGFANPPLGALNGGIRFTGNPDFKANLRNNIIDERDLTYYDNSAGATQPVPYLVIQADNGSTCSSADDCPWVYGQNNLFHGDAAPANAGNLTGSLRANPDFVNPGSDFHLLARSPAAHRGAPMPDATDFDGITLPHGRGYPVGAYAYISDDSGSTMSLGTLPAAVTLLGNQTQQFTAMVTGSLNKDVTWSLNPAAGTLSSSGLYTAPGVVFSEQTVLVTATSNSDAAKSASATIRLIANSASLGENQNTPVRESIASTLVRRRETVNTTAPVSAAPTTPVTARESFGAVSQTVSLPGVQNVLWNGYGFATVGGNGTTVQKTGGCDTCSDSGGISQQQISSGDGYFEFTIDADTKLKYAGLNDGSTTLRYLFGIFPSISDVEVMDGGSYRTDTRYVAGDVFRIQVTGGQITYLKNGALLYTSSLAPAYPLALRVNLTGMNSSFGNARVSASVAPGVVAAPTFGPTPATYSSTQNVTISTTTAGASIRYTTNGTTPTETVGTLYSGLVTVSSTTTFKAIAYKTGMTDSSVSSATFNITVPLPGVQNVLWNGYGFATVGGNGTTVQKTGGCDTCSDSGGISQQPITSGNGYFEFTIDADTKLKYAGLNDGPTTLRYLFAIYPSISDIEVVDGGSYRTDTRYVAGDVFRIQVTGGQVTYLKNGALLYTSSLAPAYPLALRVNLTGMNSSFGNARVSASVAPGVVAAPTFGPTPGTYSSTQNVTISTTTAGASIRYTTNGTTPTETVGTLYSGLATVSSTTTFKAIAYKTGMTDSSVSSATFNITTPPVPTVVAAPTFGPTPGTYSSTQSVTISTTTAGASIRYTTNGTTPTETVGTLYGGLITVSSTTTFKAIAYKTGMTDSSVSSATFNITTPPVPTVVAAPTFSPTPGTYSAAQNVTISTTTAGASIRYTTNGTTPTETVGTLYNTLLALSNTTTIKAVAYKAGMTDSAVSSATFTINITVPILHTVSLSWVGSPSPNVMGYNVYRGTASGGPYTRLNPLPVNATGYKDATVQSGKNYYYVATAVDSSNDESSYSPQAAVVVPSP